MVPHHRQAVEMSALAADRAGSDEVRQLATVIAQAQEPEIRQMQGFLTAWGAPQSGAMPGMGDGGMPGTGGMSGMMSDQQMQQLAQASGAGFDRMFLQMMIAHHEGAVQMARTEVAQGVDPEARAAGSSSTRWGLTGAAGPGREGDAGGRVGRSVRANSLTG